MNNETKNIRKVETQLVWKYGRWTCVVGIVEISTKKTKPEEAKEDLGKSIKLAYETATASKVEVIWK